MIKFKEYWLNSGVGTILAYKKPSETKYHILWAVTSIPSFMGSTESIDYSTTSNPTISKVPGKKTTNDVEVNIAWNRDTIAIANDISGESLQYAVIDTDNWTGWEFVAKVSYRMADVAVDGVKEMILQFTVESIEDHASVDLLDNYMDTVIFENLPETVELKVSTSEEFVVTAEPTDAAITVVASSNDVVETVYATNKVTITARASVGNTVVKVTGTKQGYAPTTRNIFVNVVA